MQSANDGVPNKIVLAPATVSKTGPVKYHLGDKEDRRNSRGESRISIRERITQKTLKTGNIKFVIHAFVVDLFPSHRFLSNVQLSSIPEINNRIGLSLICRHSTPAGQ